jgi:hypothetical protein
MNEFAAKRLPPAPDAIAPNGSGVRILLGLAGGGLVYYQIEAYFAFRNIGDTHFAPRTRTPPVGGLVRFPPRGTKPPVQS